MIFTYLQLPAVQRALVAAAVVAFSCGLIGPFVITRQMSFAVHGTSELAFTGAAAGLLLWQNPTLGALLGALVVAALIGSLGARDRERDSSIGVILAGGLALGIVLLSLYQGYAAEALNILFGNIFGVSGNQVLLLIGVAVVTSLVMLTIYRPLLFSSVDPEVATARGVRTRLVGIVFLLVLALTVTEAAQIVGTLLVLSLSIAPAAAAQRLSARPVVVTILSLIFAVAAADGGLLASLSGSVTASAYIAGISALLYVIARVAGPHLRERRRPAPKVG